LARDLTKTERSPDNLPRSRPPLFNWRRDILHYSLHGSRRTQLALAALGNKAGLHFLPPYCPDHNRIERVWRDLHDKVTRNHRCPTMDELMKEVRAYLALAPSVFVAVKAGIMGKVAETDKTDGANPKAGCMRPG
jgi:transposase